MPQVSRYKLDQELEREMFGTFWSSLSRLNSASDVSAFFSDLLTDTEEVMLTKRFIIALLLLQGKKPVDIADAIHVSFSTIRGVSEWLSRASPATKRLLSQVLKEQRWQALLDKIEALLDKLPPRWRTDWSKAGRAKWQRHKERLARQTLR